MRKGRGTDKKERKIITQNIRKKNIKQRHKNMNNSKKIEIDKMEKAKKKTIKKRKKQNIKMKISCINLCK